MGTFILIMVDGVLQLHITFMGVGVSNILSVLILLYNSVLIILWYTTADFVMVIYSVSL